MEEVRDETGWGGARSRWVLAHRMSRFPRRKRRGMVSVALIGRVEDVQDGALWATRRTGSSSRELRGAIGSIMKSTEIHIIEAAIIVMCQVLNKHAPHTKISLYYLTLESSVLES